MDIEALRDGKQLSLEHRRQLIQPVTGDEIYGALKQIGEDKAPGIDGFNSKFFKHSWSIIGDDVKKGIHEFFTHKRSYAAVNCTLVTLIPKTNTTSSVKDMRPISCCTTLYKMISKILTNRLSVVINTVIHDSQSAFLSGKVIHDNILLAQELVKGYGRKHISPRCMIQIDPQKAYDSVEWSALEGIMRELGFPDLFVDWVMLGVTTVSDRYVVNGCLTDLLMAKRGLRQGDPISPLLLVIIMEYLHLCLQKYKLQPNFNFHPC